MRNLKRTLSLVLAAAMLIGMMVVGASAANVYDSFTDKDEIVNQEAVSVLTTLNVINGKNDGSYYDPTGIVTRAEMAKMITIILNGGEDPVLGVKDTPTYTDIKGHWAESYIEYCSSSSLKIIAGRGDGRFDPGATVTAAEAAKMMLTALGYDAEVFSLTGASWQINTDVFANQANLYKGLSINSSVQLTRDNAAQMLYNALNAHIMEKSYDKVLSNGQVSYNYALSEFKTLLNDTYGAWRVEGIVVGNEYAILDNTNDHERTGETTIAVTNADELATNRSDGTALDVNDAMDGGTLNLSANDTFKVSTGHDELGKAVVMYVRPSNSSNSPGRATVIGSAIINQEANTVLTKTGAYSKQDDLDKALKNAGLKTDLTSASNYYVNGNNSGTAVYSVANATAVNKNGYSTQFIDHDADGKVDLVLVDKVDFGKVTVYSTKDDGSITVKTDGSTNKKYDSEDVVGFDEVAKGDYVLWAEVAGRLYVEKAESITGKLTDYSKQTGSDPAAASIWVDSTKYNNSGATGSDCDGSTLSAPKDYATGGGLDKEAIFYFDACGYIVAVDGTVTKQYALATYFNPDAYNSGSITTAARAQVTFEDGTSSAPVVAPKYVSGSTSGKTPATTYTALETLGAVVAGKSNLAKNVVLGSYSYNGDDELVLDADAMLELDGTADFKYTAGNVLVTSGGSNLQAGGKNVYMTDSTVLFVVETKGEAPIATAQVGKVAVYTGKDTFPSVSLEASSGFVVKYLVNSDNEITAMAIVSSKLTAVGADYLYIIKVVSSASKTKNVLAVIDGEIKNITVNSKSDAGLAGNLFEYSVDKDGNYNVTGISKNVVTGLIERVNTNESTVVVDGVEYKVTDKTDIANTADEDILTLEELVVGDMVTILHDGASAKAAKGVYVTKAHDPENSAAFGVDEDSNWDNFDADAKTADYAAADPAETVGDMLDGLNIPYGAKADAYLTETPVAGRAVEAPENVTVGNKTYSDGQLRTAVLTARTYYVVVTSQDGSSKTVYTVDVTVDGGAGDTYTVNTPAAVAANGNAGAYSATLSATSDLAANAVVTVTVTCTTAPLSGTDTITVTGTGITEVGSITHASTDGTTIANDTFTFKMPAANVADLALDVSNGSGVSHTVTNNAAAITASAGSHGAYSAPTAAATVNDGADLVVTITATALDPLNSKEVVTLTYTVDGGADQTKTAEFTTAASKNVTIAGVTGDVVIKSIAVTSKTTKATPATITFALSTVTGTPAANDTLTLTIGSDTVDWTYTDEADADAVKAALAELTITGWTLAINDDGNLVLTAENAGATTTPTTMTLGGTLAGAPVADITGSFTNGVDEATEDVTP